MKIIYLILIIFISFNLSNQTEELSEKGVNMLKCFFLTKERIDIMYSIFEKLFKTTNPMELYELIAIATKLIPIIKECTGLEIKLPFGSFQYNIILKNVQEADAPLLLRKYLYDTAVKNNIFEAKKECYQLTKMVPYDKYKNICSLFELDLEQIIK